MTEPVLGLSNVKVLSMAEQLPGPICGLLLGDLGAEVTLLERPGVGDPQRQVGPANFRFAARNKKSVALDLKDKDSLNAARRLVAQSDVLVEGFRPGVLEKLGLGYEEVSALNPQLVYCSISGYGQTGPMSHASGHNINYEAMSGLLTPFLNDAVDKYSTKDPPWGDYLSGALAALGIVSALRVAERTGRGSYLDLSITDSLVFALGPTHTRNLSNNEKTRQREGGYGIFKCTDGHIALGINHEDHMWRPLCKILSLGEYTELDHHQRLARRGQIQDSIQRVIATKSVRHWVTELAEMAACSPVNTLDDVAIDPQLSTRNLFEEAIAEDGTEFSTVRSPLAGSEPFPAIVPRLGEHTKEILDDSGVSAEAVAKIVAHNDEVGH